MPNSRSYVPISGPLEKLCATDPFLPLPLSAATAAATAAVCCCFDCCCILVNNVPGSLFYGKQPEFWRFRAMPHECCIQLRQLEAVTLARNLSSQTPFFQNLFKSSLISEPFLNPTVRHLLRTYSREPSLPPILSRTLLFLWGLVVGVQP